jgi:hypothetical protein
MKNNARPAPSSDLVVLVPDADIENTIVGLLARPEALRTRAVSWLVRRHQGRDPGCRTLGVDFLRMYAATWSHALLIFDRHGCGRDSMDANALEAELEHKLATNGWQDRAAAIVIDPELEAWVWSDSPHVDRIAGWHGRIPGLRDWLVHEGLTVAKGEKPHDPKVAFHRALRIVNKRPSSALFRQLAESVSFGRCTDRAFLKFLDKMRLWFPRTP